MKRELEVKAQQYREMSRDELEHIARYATACVRFALSGSY
jgi:hypothetical protein